MINKNLIFFISLSLGILSAQLSVSLGNVEYSGYSSDIEVPVIINNPNNSISGMQFDLMIYPDIISPFNLYLTSVLRLFPRMQRRRNKGNQNFPPESRSVGPRLL